MAHVKAIWGPLETRRHPDRAVWTFTGCYANGDYARWHLAFWFDSRRFTTKPIMGRTGNMTRERNIAAMPNFETLPVQSGRVTPMLRARLKPEHIAEATRLALEYQRKHGR